MATADEFLHSSPTPVLSDPDLSPEQVGIPTAATSDNGVVVVEQVVHRRPGQQPQSWTVRTGYPCVVNDQPYDRTYQLPDSCNWEPLSFGWLKSPSLVTVEVVSGHPVKIGTDGTPIGSFSVVGPTAPPLRFRPLPDTGYVVRAVVPGTVVRVVALPE